MAQILRHNNISYLKDSDLLKQNTGKRIKKSLKHLFKLDFQYNLMQNGPLKIRVFACTIFDTFFLSKCQQI